jgi:hypothetical protein
MSRWCSLGVLVLLDLGKRLSVVSVCTGSSRLLPVSVTSAVTSHGFD